MGILSDDWEYQPDPSPTSVFAELPEVLDGLTRLQRIVLYVLDSTRKELGRESVPTVMLYGRVLEHVNISEAKLYDILNSLGTGPGSRGQ